MKKISEINIGLSVKSLDFTPDGNIIVGTSESVIFMVKNFTKNNPQANVELLFEVSCKYTLLYKYFIYLSIYLFIYLSISVL